jgi:putative SOS response-associated peptidase YedK
MKLLLFACVPIASRQRQRRRRQQPDRQDMKHLRTPYAVEAGTNEFTELRWGFPPAQPKRPPVINFRSEGRRFPVGRCLVPASFFYEFTGSKSPKSKWKFTRIGEPWFCFAGLWRPMSEGGAAFTLLTTDPSSDVAPIHDRQMVILERSDWSAWLQETGNEADLLHALPAGSLAVEQVR